MKVFYNENQSVDISKMKLFSPSAAKPEKVIQDWGKKGYPFEIVSDFAPMTKDQIGMVHSPIYVNGIFSGKRRNGFGTTHKAIRNSFPWTTGSMVAASLHALKTGEVTMSPTSGFHHAGYNFGGGFCTFNGLMVSVAMALQAGAKKIGIVDFDMHWGNGTADIIRKIDFGVDVPHLPCPDFQGKVVTEYLKKLPDLINYIFEGCDLVLYQGGADSHINDPLGGTFTTKQFRLRDRVVFRTFKKLGIPVVWNLAGGYQQPIQKVLDLHRITIEECLRINYEDDWNEWNNGIQKSA